MADNVASSFVTDILRSGDVDAELDIILRDAAGSLYSGMLGWACVPLCGLTSNLRCCYRYREFAFYIHDVNGMVSSVGQYCSVFFTFLCRFPEAQAKAQKELDALLGHGNLREALCPISILFPRQLMDHPYIATTSTCNPSNIPYTFAVVMEMMRWRPPVWMGEYSPQTIMSWS